MIDAWTVPPTGVAADAVARMSAAIPVITTKRLVLRAPQIADWPTLEPIWTLCMSVGRVKAVKGYCTECGYACASE